MRAIIIEDKDARALLDSLKLESLRKDRPKYAESAGMSTVDTIHRTFHYIVVQWLQDQGANVVR